MSKQCSRCLKTLPLTSFHRSEREKDGLQYCCKECVRDRNRERVRNRSYYRYRAYYRDKYPEKESAHSKVRYALRTGKIIKGTCAICKEARVEAHHEDYSKPLEVIWLCRHHHLAAHLGK